MEFAVEEPVERSGLKAVEVAVEELVDASSPVGLPCTERNGDQDGCKRSKPLRFCTLELGGLSSHNESTRECLEKKVGVIPPFLT